MSRSTRSAAGGNPEWAPPAHPPRLRLVRHPGTVFDYEVATGELLLRKRQPVLGGYEPADYAQARVWATAQDGTQIPISLVWKRSFGDAGAAPRALHLYGYGSYEHSIEPGFSVPRLSELDRGVIFAVAHVRGGGEMGRQWYEDGKLLHKRNTFTDFVDSALHLIDNGYTTADRMVAEGGSAGGLLMGAVANLAPELFAGILADVPFVDALTTILDPSLPLTVIEWDEWGDPLHNADVYAYMKSYSPYENVRSDAAYPKILAVTSLNDTRVHVRRARQVGRAAARSRRGRAAEVRDGRRPRRCQRALQRVARAGFRARLAAGRGRRRRLTRGIRLGRVPHCLADRVQDRSSAQQESPGIRLRRPKPLFRRGPVSTARVRNQGAEQRHARDRGRLRRRIRGSGACSATASIAFTSASRSDRAGSQERTRASRTPYRPAGGRLLRRTKIALRSRRHAAPTAPVAWSRRNAIRREWLPHPSADRVTCVALRNFAGLSGAA